MSRFVEPLAPRLHLRAANAPAVGRGGTVGAVACAAVGAVAFSGKAIIVKLGYRHGADATTLIALRMAFALPLFAAIAFVASRRSGAMPLSRRDRAAVVVLGFLGYYFASYLDFLGLAYVSASLERLILYLNPTIVLLIGWAFLGRSTNGRQLAALVIGYAGVVVAFAHDVRIGGGGIVLGSALVFASAIAYAVYLVGSGEVVRRAGTLRLAAYASVVASVCCIVHFASTRPVATLDALPEAVWELSLVNGIFCTVLPMFAVMYGVSRLGASVASQVGMIGPVSTIVLADIFLGERMGVSQIVGTALVLVSVFVVSHAKPERSPAAASNAFIPR